MVKINVAEKVNLKVIKGRDLERLQELHNEKIKEIQNRKPFTSITLDNRTPSTLESQGLLYSNRKREATKKFLSNLTERDNKFLIQKIGLILTAPSETNPEYTPPVCTGQPRAKSPATVREEARQLYENTNLYNRIKTLQPIYHAKEWEEDYQRQLCDQARMRTIKYRRPAGFKDPFLDDKSKHDDESDAFTVGSRTVGGSTLTARTGSTVKSFNSRVAEKRKSGSQGRNVKGLPPLSNPNSNSHSNPHSNGNNGNGNGDNNGGNNGNNRGVNDDDSDSLLTSNILAIIDNMGLKDIKLKNDKKNEQNSRNSQNSSQSTSFGRVLGSHANSSHFPTLNRSKSKEKEIDEYVNGKREKPLSSRSFHNRSGDHLVLYGNDTESLKTPKSPKYGSHGTPKNGLREDLMSMRLSREENEEYAPMGYMNESSMYRNDFKRALRQDLAAVDRRIRIYNVELEDEQRSEQEEGRFPFPAQAPVGSSTCAFTPRQSECRSFYTARAKLECWVLPQRRTLLIRAELPDSFPVIEVEAEVSVFDLAASRGRDVDSLLVDPELGEIAKELILEAELTVEDRENRTGAFVKNNDSLDPTYLKQKNGQVVSIVVHMSKTGEDSTQTHKHASISQAFIDALTEDIPPLGGGPDTNFEPATFTKSKKVELRKMVDIMVTHTVPSRAIQMLAWKTAAPLLGKRRESCREPLSRSSSQLTTGNGSITHNPLGNSSLGYSSHGNSVKNLKFDGYNSTNQSMRDINAPPGNDPQNYPKNYPNSGSNTPAGFRTPRSAAPRSPAPTFSRNILIHKPSVEYMPAVVTISASDIGADMAYVNIRFIEDSTDNQYNRVAILADTQVAASTGLPSIMQADPELTLEFFENLFRGLSVEHDSNTKINKCLIEVTEGELS